MSTVTVISTKAGAGKVTLPRVVNSEWIKFRTLRSSYFTLLAAVVFMIGFGLLACYGAIDHLNHPDIHDHGGPFQVDAADRSLRGYLAAQLAIGVLGVLVVSGEYSTGMIRASMSAVPRRLPVLWAKAAVFGAVTLVLTGVTAFVAFFGGQAILSANHVQTTLSATGVLRTVLGTALYLTLVGLLAVAIGALIRNTAGGIAAVFGLLLVLPTLVEVLPASWGTHISPYLPGAAGQAVATLNPDPGTLAPWTGFAVMCVYVVVALAGAATVLKRRDA
ncbi:ABC-2 type transport system permease protein [Kitasatospora sp. MAP12-15]|uniref:ABC transporter permease subunit n=1 Tax=unclassified Kitasatospora TaxID=2633591 RepID=UPI0024757F63|nr:ABC transporter permease subunit [Kitasatospora sp. MAP12-44]MDH6110301.1 ABC-2 type transport system permease protein [Kitasatospora sp. MAP12-44]